MNLKFSWFWIGLSVLFLVACSTTTPSLTPTLIPEVPSASPVVEMSETPGEGIGVIMGSLCFRQTNLPAAGIDVYLAKIIGSQEEFAVAALDMLRAPKSHTDDNGGFVFTEVPLSRYALVVFCPPESFVVEASAGKPLVVSIEQAREIDLGVIYIDADACSFYSPPP